MPAQEWGLSATPTPDSDDKESAGLTRADVDEEARRDRYVNLGEVQMKYGDGGRDGEPHGDPKPAPPLPEARNVVDLTDQENNRKSPLETLSTDRIDQPTESGTPASRKASLPLKQDAE